MGGGACLSHDHATQFTFVYQSLSLWREIMRNMPKLWLLADSDMLNESYRLCDTGCQGYYYLVITIIITTIIPLIIVLSLFSRL